MHGAQAASPSPATNTSSGGGSQGPAAPRPPHLIRARPAREGVQVGGRSLPCSSRAGAQPPGPGGAAELVGAQGRQPARVAQYQHAGELGGPSGCLVLSDPGQLLPDSIQLCKAELYSATQGSSGLVLSDPGQGSLDSTTNSRIHRRIYRVFNVTCLGTCSQYQLSKSRGVARREEARRCHEDADASPTDVCQRQVLRLLQQILHWQGAPP